MTATQVSTADKIRVLQRELAIRRSVYPRQVAAHKMQQLEADYQIEVMAAILADYEKRGKNEKAAV
jgi:hypothetical protein